MLWDNDGQTHHPEFATYTPKGAPEQSWLPIVSSIASTLIVGSSANPVAGTNFNGFSQGGHTAMTRRCRPTIRSFRITNNSADNVCFGRSYDFSTMGVWTSGTTNAVFDIPSTCETGASTLQVIVSALASAGVSVTLND